MSAPFTVWLASYPKSGNTWVRALLAALDQGEATSINTLGEGPIASSRSVLGAWLGFPTSDLRRAEIGRLRPLADAAFDAKQSAPRFRKIHDALFTGPGNAPIVPPQATRGAVFIVRDPRDVAVSLAHHTDRTVEAIVRSMEGTKGELNGQVRAVGQLPQTHGDWSEHVESWLNHDLFPVLLVRYEDLHASGARELRRIADLGGLEPSDAQVATAVEAAGFNRLSAEEEHTPFRERTRPGSRFFRSGLVGGWRQELPEELARRIERRHATVMTRLGYLDAEPDSAGGDAEFDSAPGV